MATTRLARGSFLETNIASAATCDIGTSSTRKVNITGGVTITSFGVSPKRELLLRFAAALTLTHNATSLILPGDANMTTAAGDTFIATSDASGNWTVRAYQKASGKAVTGPAAADITDASANARSLITAANYSAMRTLLGLALGTDIYSKSGADAAIAAAVAALVNSAPAILDTLEEIADALGDDPNFAATMVAALALKAPLASPALTGTPTAPTAAGSTSSTQLATMAAVQAAILAAGGGAGLSAKNAVIVATTANITLSGEQTLDGVLTAASRVLVKDQTAPAQNGIYVSGAGAWSRATDMDSWAEVPGAILSVEQGTTLHDTVWNCTSDAGGTLGTTAITWQRLQDYSGKLAALAVLAWAADKLPYFTSASAVATTTLSAFMRTHLADADAAAAKSTLGIVNVQSFTASGTWIKPAGATSVYVLLIGSGGSGGGGARTVSGNASSGGAGGGGAGVKRRWFSASDLGSTETVTIPAVPSSGGAGATADGNAGSNGGVGGSATFGSHLTAHGGGGGAGGQLAGAAGGGGGAGWLSAGGSSTSGSAGGAGGGGGGAGGAGVGAASVSGVGCAAGGGGGANGAVGTTGGSAGDGAAGGGSGGGISTTPAQFSGGTGGCTEGTYSFPAGGTATNPGTTPAAKTTKQGAGGGGGGSNIAGVGGAGGDGGSYGGGGGDGGSAIGGNGGKGGNGGPAICIVISI